MRKLFAMSPGRATALVAAVIFAIYAFIALALEGRPHGQTQLAQIAGISAYIFLACAIALYVNAWRRRPSAADRTVVRFLEMHPVVAQRMGAPCVATLSERVGHPAGPDGALTPVIAQVRGPLGDARAELTLSKVGTMWQVVAAELVRDDGRVTLPIAK
jgi:hypothetical protein